MIKKEAFEKLRSRLIVHEHMMQWRLWAVNVTNPAMVGKIRYISKEAIRNARAQ